MKVTIVTPDLEDNSLGRTYCIWMLGRALGWSMDVISSRGDTVWQPMAGSAFAADCRRPGEDAASFASALKASAEKADVIIAIKPLPESLGFALDASRRTGTCLIVDVDDPDIEVRTTWASPVRQVQTWLTQPRRQHQLRRLGRAARGLPSLTSNPILQRRYGGIVVPHARPSVAPPASRPVRTETRVAFVGSPKAHKGIDDLRAAVAYLAEDGFELVVTGERPEDAAPWETWTGQVSFAQGMDIVSSADIIAIPSHRSGWSRAQLPAKLIDAMMFGRAVIVTDVGPMGWALGGTGVVIPAHDRDALRDALASLHSPSLRQQMGVRAHARAISEFSVESLAPKLHEYCQNVLKEYGEPT